MINEWQRIWDEEVVAELEACFGICLEGLARSTKNLRTSVLQASYLYPGPFEHSVGIFPTCL